MNEMTQYRKPLKFGPAKSMKDKINERREKAALLLKSLDPKAVEHRIGIILDDSGSTAGGCWGYEIQAVNKILAASLFSTTSYSLYKLNEKLVQDLTCDYDKLLAKLPYFASGSTPLLEAIEATLSTQPNITRLIVVSDGLPDTRNNIDTILGRYIDKKIKIDTIYVKSAMYSDSFSFNAEDDPKEFLRLIATKTGGIFMCFDDLGNFSNAAGYLSPGLRGQLENKETRLLLGSKED